MTSQLIKIPLKIPSKLREIVNPHPYKVLYGGRGGGKSHSVARVLLYQGAMRKMLILCTRELQKSIKDSVHRLLSDQIYEMGLQDFYEIQKQSITGQNGTEFIFSGLKNDPAAVKSLEGLDAVFCEEAENISQTSWDMLIPTVRKAGAEIWVVFNPDDILNDTWQRFVVEPPEHALVIKINWDDNPWFPNSLKAQKDEMKKRDYQKYLHIWEGEPNTDYTDSLIQPQWFDAAIDAHRKIPFEAQGLRCVGFDPADDGSDAKALVYRYGSVVQHFEQWDHGDLHDAIKKTFTYADHERVDSIIYDAIGIGAGVKIALKTLSPSDRILYQSFYGSNSPNDPGIKYMDDRPNRDIFRNLRAQQYWLLRDRFEATYHAIVNDVYTDPENMISFPSELPYLTVLKSELCRIKRKRATTASMIQIESKEDMKREGHKSPNMADALMMAFSPTKQVFNRQTQPIVYKNTGIV